MFTGFDFGKSLLRQVEAYKRLPLAQQPRKEPALVHQLETYTKKFMIVLSNPGTTANPGLLKNGAEALLEVALMLQESHISYTAFADMVARSRKVPVVPGLAGLIDRLLELPSDMKTERVMMLNWRITTGSLRPERYLMYLSERAKLTADSADWKDYAYALAQLIKKGTLKPSDDAAFTALEDLIANKGLLGDRIVGIQLAYAEGLIGRKNQRQAESVLIALTAESKQLPENYVQVVMQLLDSRPEASWELHQSALMYLITGYIDGKFTWSQFLQRAERAHAHTDNLVEFLLNSPQMPKDEKLCTFTVERIKALDPHQVPEYIERWGIVLANAGVEPPESALAVLERQGSSVPVMPREPAESAGPEQQATASGTSGAEEPSATALELDAWPEPEEAKTPSEAQEEVPQAEVAPEEPALEQTAVDDELQPLVLEPEAEDEDEAADAPAADTVELQDDELAAFDANGEPKLAEPVAEESLTADPVEITAQETELLLDTAADTETKPDVEAGPDVTIAEEPTAIEELAAECAGSAEHLDLAALVKREDVAACLSGWVSTVALDEACITKLNARFTEPELPDWLAAEGRLWFAEWLAGEGALNSALEQLAGVETSDPSIAREYRQRIARLVGGEELPAQAIAVLGRLALIAEDYQGALAAAMELAEADPARSGLLGSIEERLLAMSEPGPQLLLVLAQARRAAMHDPQAGFEVATTASLLALDDVAVQQLYSGWAVALPADALHRQRAQQATYLCVHQQRLELLEVALSEFEALAAFPQTIHDPPVLEWLEQLRPELENLTGKQQSELRLRWTRLYLEHVVRAGQRERIPAVLQQAAEQIEPEAALSLVSELAAQIPVETRRAIECESYLRQGAWERAVDVALVEEGAETYAMPLERLCQRLPENALLPASQRITQVLVDRGDEAGRLDVVRFIGERAGGNGHDESEGELRGFLEHVLTELCERQFAPAVRYRLQLGHADDPQELAHDLLALVRQGDSEALNQLFAVFGKLIESDAPAELLFETADELARANPESAITILVQVGQATGEAARALSRIDALGLVVDKADAIVKLGQLATLAQDHNRMLAIARQLSAQREHNSALALVRSVLAADPEMDLAQIELIKLELDGDTRDFKLATSNLLHLAQLYQERGIRPRQALDPLKQAIDAACATEPNDQDALHLKLTMLALSGELERAAQLVQQIMLRGPQAADGLLALFERLAMEDAELPSPMLIAWGRALFRAGRVDAALSRLAGLRDAVGDFPEYAELLEEIKAAGGGPGAAMQLGETYLRVHLWQRSAEEYSTALAQDPALAEPVLTQLRHHAALDPNPMKYPLHLLALRAVANSSRQADWGWALSALMWLIPRWSAEELYGLAKSLWEQHHLGDLDEVQRTELLLHLFRLANKLGHADAALQYFGFAWEALESPTPELLQALREFDATKLPEDSAQWLTLRKYQTVAAMQQAEPPDVIQAAHKLAQVSEEGRTTALGMLAQYQQGLDEPLPVMLARLRLLNLGDADERDTFVHELLGAAGSGLPREQVRSLVDTVLDLVQESVDSPELTQLLMLLFRQLGDQSRAWQLATCYVLGDDPPAPTALETIRSVAADEFAVRQRVALVEVLYVREDYEAAAAALEELSWSNLGELAPAAEDLAEALLATSAAPSARRWLISRLRDAGQPVLAADHLLWAHAQGNPQPAEWLNEQRNGNLLYRAAMLQEIQGSSDAARKTYARARDGATADNYTAASIRWRLAELTAAAGNLEEARALCTEVLQLVPDYAPAQARIATLTRAIAQQQIEAARSAEEDSPERTVKIVGLLRAIGDLNEAINELQAALSRGQNVPEVYIELAECFTDSGDYPIARRAYTGVLKGLEQGGNVELKLRALYGLATAEEQLGERGEAARCLEELLLIRRDYRDARQRLGRVQGKAQSAARKPAEHPQGGLVDEILLLLGVSEDEDGNKPQEPRAK